MLLSRFRSAFLLTSALALVAFVGASPALAAPTLPSQASSVAESHVAVCPSPAPAGTARCFALRRTDATAVNSKPAPGRRPAPSPNGSTGSATTLGNSGAYDPSYLESAYNVWNAALANGGNQTVTIVDAYDDPHAASDLAYYRSFFGLPAANFQKVNQSGATSPLPKGSSSWAQEISLDLDMVSAICPNCKILLVEANSSSYSDLTTAVTTAANMGATAISNSYGSSEFSTESSYDSTYNHPGTAVTVSSGDNGYGVEYPAASQYVTAVGGTSLNQATNTGTRNATETVWSGAGSGCSAYETKPSWQKDSGCSKRTVADVSAVADPNTGVWVYDTYAGSGWYIFGGTSVASPIVSSVYALAQSNGNTSLESASFPYANPTDLNDITSGSNGACSPAYLCTGESGYDGPSGLGTPNSTSAFAPGPTLPPTVTGISPNTGYTTGGTTVTISGSNLSGATAVNFGSTAAQSFSYNSSNGTISAVSPAEGTGTVDVTVTTPAGTSATSSADQFTYSLAPAPAVTGVSPTSGSTAGGTSVIISGTNLAGATAVNFGSVAAQSFSYNRSTATISAVSPAEPVGMVNVTVATPSGTSSTSSADQFSYVTSDFSLSGSPSSTSVSPGHSASYSVAVNAINGYSSSVNLSVSGLPGGASASFSPNPVSFSSSSSQSSTLTISTTTSTPAGSYAMTLTGAGADGTSHTASVTLVVDDFSLSPTTSSLTVTRGSSSSEVFTLTSIDGYAQAVTMSISNLPRRTSASFLPNPATLPASGATTTLTISAQRNAPTNGGNPYTLTVTAKGADGSTRTATVALTIQ